MTVSLLTVAVLLVAGSTAAFGDDTSRDPPPRFRVTARRPDDRVQVRADGDRAVLDVTSPFGISQAVIRREGAWPGAVVLRLHLKGLSHFHASNGKVTLDASASAEGGKASVRVWKDGKEDAPLDTKSALWVNVRIVGGDGRPAPELPLKGGYFEVTLPRAFFAANPDSITVSWIDFYRQ